MEEWQTNVRKMARIAMLQDAVLGTRTVCSIARVSRFLIRVLARRG